MKALPTIELLNEQGTAVLCKYPVRVQYYITYIVRPKDMPDIILDIIIISII